MSPHIFCVSSRRRFCCLNSCTFATNRFSQSLSAEALLRAGADHLLFFTSFLPRKLFSPPAGVGLLGLFNAGLPSLFFVRPYPVYCARELANHLPRSHWGQLTWGASWWRDQVSSLFIVFSPHLNKTRAVHRLKVASSRLPPSSASPHISPCKLFCGKRFFLLFRPPCPLDCIIWLLTWWGDFYPGWCHPRKNQFEGALPPGTPRHPFAAFPACVRSDFFLTTPSELLEIFHFLLMMILFSDFFFFLVELKVPLF